MLNIFKGKKGGAKKFKCVRCGKKVDRLNPLPKGKGGQCDDCSNN